jgi:hypothetical protein
MRAADHRPQFKRIARLGHPGPDGGQGAAAQPGTARSPGQRKGPAHNKAEPCRGQRYFQPRRAGIVAKQQVGHGQRQRIHRPGAAKALMPVAVAPAILHGGQRRDLQHLDHASTSTA